MSESKLMTRGLKILAAGACCALAGCQRPVAIPPNLFPASAAGGWQRVVAREVPVSEAPDPVPRNEIEWLEEGLYEGSGKVDARVYALSSATVGLELSQRWRPSADTVFFSRGYFFVVIKWQAAQRQALESFMRELQGRLGPPDSLPRS
ncbi:MAG: hypothetical protein ACLQPN_13205 [Bryobacteraceae bacterium]